MRSDAKERLGPGGLDAPAAALRPPTCGRMAYAALVADLFEDGASSETLPRALDVTVVRP